MDSSMERVTNELKLEASSKEKVTNELELAASKREILEKSFQSQWKDLEEGFVSVKKLTEERIEEAEKSSERRSEAKEKRLLAMQKLFDEEKSAFEKKKKLDEQKEEWREKRLEAKSKAIDVRNEEVEFREKQFESVRETIEKQFVVLGKEEKRLRLMKQSVDERLIEVELKERELDVERKAFDEQCEAVRSKEMELDVERKAINEQCEAVRSKETELDVERKAINEQCEAVRSKETELDVERKATEKQWEAVRSQEKEIQKRANAVRCSNEQLSRELELKAETITEKLKKLESNELSSIQRNNELENLPCSSNPVNLRFFVEMDGKKLQMFLNNRLAGGCQSLDDEVYIVIQTSSDPAKLVLDAMQGFYPPHLKEGDIEFEITTARKTCILLLRQVMRVSPQLKRHVLEDAMKLAGEWQSKMDSENSLEVLGFLHLVASYKLASYYKLEELLSLWQMLDERDQPPQLCQALGFANKAPRRENIGKKRKECTAPTPMTSPNVNANPNPDLNLTCTSSSIPSLTHTSASISNISTTSFPTGPPDSMPQFNQSARHYSLSAGPYVFTGPTSIPLPHPGSSAGEYRSSIPENGPTPPQLGFAGPMNGYPGNVNAQHYRRPRRHPSMDRTARFNSSVPYYLRDADAAPHYYDRPTSDGV